MLNFEELDKLYCVAENMNTMRLSRKGRNLTFGDEMTVSDAFNKVKDSIVSKPFDVESSDFASLEDFIVARKLNDELKIISPQFSTLVFGNLDHLVTKQPISYSEEFKRPNKYTEHEIDVANQVLFLSQEKDGDKEKVMHFRKYLVNLLKTGSATTTEELVELFFE